MERNNTIMQFFEWHLEPDGSHWRRLKEKAPELREKGITSVWIPPVTKAITAEDTGYAPYDLYDLGEFKQKDTVRTKYGTRQELEEAISACHNVGIKVYIDVVMNHKAGADKTEVFKVVEVDQENRTEEISEPFDIEGWTSFTFPGRKGKYSSFQWNFKHFNGTDYDEKTGNFGVFKILGDHKDWNDHVDEEFGNYDYLMFANIDYDHPDVKKEMISWGKWLADTLNCDGYRLDAIKHINHHFISEFVEEMLKHRGDDFYFVGEFWKHELIPNQIYLDHVNYNIDLFDVPLHYRLHQASNEGRDFDLTNIFEGTLVNSHPDHAVTFVDNHDSQPHEALESWIQDWFKPSAYALILLRKEGNPCVFYGDYFGIGGPVPVDGKKEILDILLSVRYEKAYGEQIDYFDHPNTIGWVRLGDNDLENSGCAVVISNGDDGEKRMYVGESKAGEIWKDVTNSREEEIVIDEKGFATFPVHGGSVSVWACSSDE
ncbi:alpha-amylase [Mesobacillus foraminis]|uniref:alpha-amylase n=1 Tax=Mesobacillus foraminis TaxID=279826 RepID=UPI001BEAD8D9|nr:alpha-amylase [Mesobacillus foraminis]MBT2757699.1 alpha-amylase [Mesobacillus foraminis]